MTNDKKLKKDTYARLGIGEYIVYDPEAEKPWVAVQGNRLDVETKKCVRALKRDKRGAVRSRALGVSLRAEASRLVVRNMRTCEDYAPTGKVRKLLERASERANLLAAQGDAERDRADQVAATLEDKDREIQELKRQMAAQLRFSLNEGRREIRRGR